MPRPRGFDEEDVLQRAMQLFWAQGYRETSPQDLLDATGLSKSSLYASFGSKEQLFIKALDRYVAAQERWMRGVVESTDLRSGLTQMYSAIIDMNTCSSQARSCLVCTTAIDSSPSEPLVAARASRGMDKLKAILRQRLHRAQREGELAAERDAHAIADFLMTCNMGLQVMAKGGTQREALLRIATEIVDGVVR